MPPREDERRLRTLPARPLDELLEELASLQRRELGGEPVRVPRVTVHLVSGRELSGTVLQYTVLRNESVVLVRTGAQTRHDAGADATYVPLNFIEALTVHEAASHAESLTPGGKAPPAEPPPTRLAARRAVEAHRQELAALLQADVAWSAAIDATPDGEPLRALVQLSRDVASALKAAGGDEMGRSAILARIQRVLIESGDAVSVRLDGEALCVGAPAHSRRSVEELRADIERLL